MLSNYDNLASKAIISKLKLLAPVIATTYEQIDTANDDETLEKLHDKLEELELPYFRKLDTLQKRATDEEFNLAIELLADNDDIIKVIGLDLLGGLGYDIENTDQKHTLQLNINKVLSPLLSSSSAKVLSAVVTALDKQVIDENDEPLPNLLLLANHEDYLVRHAVTLALSQYEHPKAIQTLILLARDENALVRDWAVFGLGSLTEQDTPEIRAVLHHSLNDEDAHVRGEALVGLAERNDLSVLEKLKQELQGTFESSHAIDACKLLADPSLLPFLIDLKNNQVSIDTIFNHQIDLLNEAIEACHK